MRRPRSTGFARMCPNARCITGKMPPPDWSHKICGSRCRRSQVAVLRECAQFRPATAGDIAHLSRNDRAPVSHVIIGSKWQRNVWRWQSFTGYVEGIESTISEVNDAHNSFFLLDALAACCQRHRDCDWGHAVRY